MVVMLLLSVFNYFWFFSLIKVSDKLVILIEVI